MENILFYITSLILLGSEIFLFFGKDIPKQFLIDLKDKEHGFVGILIYIGILVVLITNLILWGFFGLFTSGWYIVLIYFFYYIFNLVLLKKIKLFNSFYRGLKFIISIFLIILSVLQSYHGLLNDYIQL